MSKAISRRDFLKVSGAVGAAGLLAACGGSGNAGSTATSTAASSAAASVAGYTPKVTGRIERFQITILYDLNRQLINFHIIFSVIF